MFCDPFAPMIACVETLGERIQLGLDKKEWRPNRLAAVLDVDTDTVRRWLKGLNKPRVDDVPLIADTLGFSVAWLLTGQEQPYDDKTTLAFWDVMRGAADALEERAANPPAEVTEEWLARLRMDVEALDVAQQMLSVTSDERTQVARTRIADVLRALSDERSGRVDPQTATEDLGDALAAKARKRAARGQRQPRSRPSRDG